MKRRLDLAISEEINGVWVELRVRVSPEALCNILQETADAYEDEPFASLIQAAVEAMQNKLLEVRHAVCQNLLSTSCDLLQESLAETMAARAAAAKPANPITGAGA